MHKTAWVLDVDSNLALSTLCLYFVDHKYENLTVANLTLIIPLHILPIQGSENTVVFI